MKSFSLLIVTQNRWTLLQWDCGWWNKNAWASNCWMAGKYCAYSVYTFICGRIVDDFCQTCLVWHENDAARHCVVDIWWTIYLFGLNWSIRQCSMNGTIHTKSVYFTIFYLQKFIYPSIYENKCLSTQCGQLHTALQIVQYSLCVICTGDCRRYICSCFFLYCFVRIYLIPLSMQICINGCVLFILNTNTFYSGYAKWG